MLETQNGRVWNGLQDVLAEEMGDEDFLNVTCVDNEEVCASASANENGVYAILGTESLVWGNLTKKFTKFSREM